MSDKRWARIGELFHELAGQSHAVQQAGLRSLGEDDLELAREVASLLRADRVSSPIDAGAEGLVAELGDDPVALATSAGQAGLIGRRLGAWKLVAPLGSGGMGVVYLAERADGAFTQRAAVKVLRQSLDSPELQRRFLLERQLLARLEHPAIVRLLDGGVSDDGLPWFALELVDGVPITAYVRERRLGVRQRVALLLEVCAAVESAHRRLVVHRDLKPSNVLVTEEGSVKLLDFGIAKVLEGIEDAALTRTEQRPLTPQYAAPEQILGEPVTVAVDVYTLGVMLYELLADALPHDRSQTRAARLARELEGERTVAPSERVRRLGVEGAKELAVELAGDLDAIALMALRPEPERRYPSVAALADDLRRFLDHQPVAARSGERAYRAARFVRRHRAMVAASALAAAGLVGGLIATAWQASIAREHAAVAERRLADTRALANSLLFEIHDAVRDVEGATAARELVLQRALEHLERLTPEAADNPELSREVATGYERIGDIQGSLIASASRGRVDDAAESLRRAIVLREALAARAGASWEDRLALARAVGQLDVIERGRGNWSASQRHADRQLALAEELVGERPEDQEAVALLARALVAVHASSAVIAGDDGRPDLVERALDLQRRLLAARPHDSELLLAIATSLRSLGSIANTRGDVASCLRHMREAAEIHEDLFRRSPGSVELRSELLKTLLLLSPCSPPVEAVATLARADELAAAAVAADPANLNMVAQRMGVVVQAAVAYRDLGDLEAAVAKQQQGVELLSVLWSGPQRAPYLAVYALRTYRDLGDLRRDLAQARREAGARRRELLAAQAAYRRAAELAAGLDDELAADAQAREVVASLAERRTEIEQALAAAGR